MDARMAGSMGGYSNAGEEKRRKAFADFERRDEWPRDMFLRKFCPRFSTDKIFSQKFYIPGCTIGLGVFHTPRRDMFLRKNVVFRPIYRRLSRMRDPSQSSSAPIAFSGRHRLKT
jgi:hypothetical protein